MKKQQHKTRGLKINKEMLKIAYVFSAIFFAMMVYFVYFQVTQADSIANDSHNKRQQVYQEQIVRGKILASGGEVLAYTDTDEEGNETRVYPYKNLFTHVVGINNHGKSGLELANNLDMLKSNSNPVNKIVNELKDEKSIGDNISTTLDVKLQQAAYDALGNYDGAVVVMDPKTGKILSMVSKPDYNPNTVSSDWEEINKDNDRGVLVNRATQGKYTPGSVFKIFTALNYIQNNDFENFTFDCVGSVTFDTKDQYTIRCYYGDVHGHENLENAFAYSCNSAFATIGSKFDGEQFEKFGTKMLFNTNLPLTIENSKSSLNIDKFSTLFDLTQTAIGQGKTLVTPMHMVMVASAICNDGVLMKPYLVDSIDAADGTKTVDTNSPVKYKDLMTKSEAGILQGYMTAVVNYGTAGILKTDYYEAAGKTGTAQIDNKDNINSWFVGYIKKDGKEYAVCTVLEAITEGTGTASNIVRTMFDNYFNSITE